MQGKVFESGMHDISIDDYHTSHGVSRSALWLYHESPLKYWHQYLSGKFVRKSNEDFLIGHVLHKMMLEPRSFHDEYFVAPKVNRATKAGKLAYAENISEAAGRVLVNQEQFDMCRSMENSIMRSNLVSEILQGAVCEKSIFWTDEETEIQCKARPDIISSSGSIVADLKTTKDASPEAFPRSAAKCGYFLQAAMLHEATKSIGVVFDKFVFICVEKEPPYCSSIFVLTDDALQYGLDLFHDILMRYKKSLQAKHWDDYPMHYLDIPAYLKKREKNG